MSCSLISWKAFALENTYNIDSQLKCNLCKNNLIKFCINCKNDEKKSENIKCCIARCNNSGFYSYINSERIYCDKHKSMKMININDCKIVKGKCGCYYHSHCLNIWKRINKVCPNCENIWDLEQML